jgi:exodeoxyribonuclease VII large subunit
VPVITGVGHETDFTIADFVADLRAPTPTGAATLATPDRRELAASVRGMAASAQIQMQAHLTGARSGTDALAHRLGRQSPSLHIDRDRQRVDDLSRRASLATAARLRSARERLRSQRLHLSALDPFAVLSRGYAIVSKSDGSVVGSVAQVARGDALSVRVADGEFGATVTMGDGR